MRVMRKFFYIILACVAVAAVSCKPKTAAPRPTIPLVEQIARDTSGLAERVAAAGHRGAEGGIAVIGQSGDAASLSRLFYNADILDNIDGRPVRDSLPDFAGERLDVILDEVSGDYSHFYPSQTDSLRESAVSCAMHAWNAPILAKALVYASPLQSEYGLFDVDTLQALTGGASRVFSPVGSSIAQAAAHGAKNIGVWASREIREAQVYEHAFLVSGVEGSLVSITPVQALDVRTSFRNFLRQYRESGKTLDALVLSSYHVDPRPIRSEVALIRRAATEEDMAFSALLPRGFQIITPGEAVMADVYSWLRKENLFTHRIARPQLNYYQTVENPAGGTALEPLDISFVRNTYVQEFD